MDSKVNKDIDTGQYEEIITTMEELQPGDKVLGVDGNWYDFEILPIHIPLSMYRITFENGKIDCSGTHLWTLFNEKGDPFTRETMEIYENLDVYSKFYVGEIGGPKILKIEEIEPVESRCIQTGAPGNLFQVILDTAEKSKGIPTVNTSSDTELFEVVNIDDIKDNNLNISEKLEIKMKNKKFKVIRE